ncbi:hypothetical protein ABIA68_002281 [Stenotrophomonas rhizophila]|uniref:hypothetical protein n=1 Tax=Stenotrophomonas rhizophila TaxID=216778 RepID=UPI0033944D72
MPILSSRPLLLAAVLASTACTPSPDAEGPPQPTGGDPGAGKAAVTHEARATSSPPAYAFSETPPGIALAAVPGMELRRDFTRSYLTLDGWKLFDASGSTGSPLAALVLDGSNEVTAAELRVGRSDDAGAVADCLAPPAEATGPADTVDIGGVSFTHFPVGDAAMSHYVSADSYRAVQHGRCYAIDLVVAGTQPDVYDPPRTPPFSTEDARDKLAAALKAVRWVE